MNTDAGLLGQVVRSHLSESADLKREVSQDCIEPILSAAELIAKCLEAGGKVLLCGNGGSAADCQHMSAEFVSCLNHDFNRPGLASIALTTDTSFLTAFANDSNFEGVFQRQVQALGRPGDVLIAISTSGNSANVLLAVEEATASGIGTVALTGNSGRLAGLVDVAVAVPSGNTQHIQESHLAIEHIICELVEYHLFAEAKGK